MLSSQSTKMHFKLCFCLERIVDLIMMIFIFFCNFTVLLSYVLKEFEQDVTYSIFVNKKDLEEALG